MKSKERYIETLNRTLRKRTNLVIFFAVMFIITSIIRVQFPVFSEVLLESRLFFQLMVAVTFLAFMRSFVGINTYGVFAPAIISFALLEAGVFWGVVLFLDIFILVMFIRFLMDPLKMGSSYRVAILVILVALFITLLEIVGEISHIAPLESSLLFPALITSWYADRYVNKVKEVGWTEPNKQLFWTMIAIILSYFLMSIDILITWVMTNPEVWVILILLNIFLAKKARFRLTEYVRFDKLISPGLGRLKGFRHVHYLRDIFSGDKVLSKDIMGMNTRNMKYIERYNPRNFFPAVEKLNMKKTLLGLGIPTPSIYSVASEKRHLKECRELFPKLNSFVIKPNKSLGGEGIMVVVKNENRMFTTIEGERVTLDDLLSHVNQIIDGHYSVTEWDLAVIEELVVPDKFFEGKYHKGVPDIRVIVFNGFPVMSMCRLPTKQSGGKANIHKGAIGVGLDISTGRAVSTYSKGLGRSMKTHPDTGERIDSFRVPGWRSILEIAVKAQYASMLMYAGVDIVIDKDKGPLVLEVNKRPGLAIQNTNLSGLMKRVALIEKHLPEYEFLKPEQKIDMAIKWDKRGWDE